MAGASEVGEGREGFLNRGGVISLSSVCASVSLFAWKLAVLALMVRRAMLDACTNARLPAGLASICPRRTLDEVRKSL